MLPCAEYSTVESRHNLNRNNLTLEELRRFDDRGVAVTLDGLEVGPVLGDHLSFPAPRADCDQDVQCEALRSSGVAGVLVSRVANAVDY